MINDSRIKRTLSKKYQIALKKLIDIAIKSRKPIVDTIVLIGSPMHSNNIICTDLDLCFYIPKIYYSKTLLTKIYDMFKEDVQWLERPRYIIDYQNIRIEGTVLYREVEFEITFLDLRLNHENTPHLIYKDNFERYIGNLLIYGIVLFNRKSSKYLQFRQKFLPYYNEPLRLKRLKTVRNAIVQRLEKINDYDDVSKFIQFNKILTYLLQYIFIKKKIYPYHYEKWMDRQFLSLINDPDTYSLFKYIYRIDNLPLKINKINRFLK